MGMLRTRRARSSSRATPSSANRPPSIASVGKGELKKTWQLVELHGCWWAYEGELPPPEAFQSHRRPLRPLILGPYPSRAIAEALLR